MQKQIEKNNLFKEANPTLGNSNEYYKLSFHKTTSENYSRIKERRREGKAYDLLNNNPLSLYSTATQNSGVGGWRWAIAPTPDFCVGDTNMLVYFALGDANFSRFYPT